MLSVPVKVTKDNTIYNERSFELIEPNSRATMTSNKRILFVLVALVIILPVITGILVWYFTPKCDSDKPKGNEFFMTSRVPVSTAAPFDRTELHIVPKGTTAAPFEDGPWKELRLPRTVIPVHYEITLHPDFYGNNAWFYGKETIEIDVIESTCHILIHINYLNITMTSLEDSNGNAIEISRTFEYKPNQFLVIETKEMLQQGQRVKLRISFDGSLTRSIVGLYKSVYTNSLTGEKRYSIDTLFAVKIRYVSRISKLNRQKKNGRFLFFSIPNTLW